MWAWRGSRAFLRREDAVLLEQIVLNRREPMPSSAMLALTQGTEPHRMEALKDLVARRPESVPVIADR